MKKVIITVNGGVAELHEKPDDVEVQIIDYDTDGIAAVGKLSADPLSTDHDNLCCIISNYV